MLLVLLYTVGRRRLSIRDTFPKLYHMLEKREIEFQNSTELFEKS
ncbi:hypothetical protein CLOSTASPAR_04857 [[Clostridium] asparagiforme DSM 15981]|uniref:Uncharacterized protein n=1 Tax=[Clostridium] asparagiforme DSM 15981 TaxID=518636 RepID=C0D6G0_9FIRM|nr:hypothetical protein CLOSTASPAR_04857 [[Clostridium] asparagiforme DSM 15981]